MNKWFNERGELIREIPEQCVKDCSHPGPCDVDTENWVDELEFEVPRELAIKYIENSGAWSNQELVGESDRELAIIVLWFACGEIADEGEWLGLIN